MTRPTAEVCVVGMGPSGLGTALGFARTSLAPSVLCLEAGVAADHKFCSILQNKGCRIVQPCQMISGVGGSSVLSGGKISGYPAGKTMSIAIGDQEETRNSLDRALGIFCEFVPLMSPNISEDVQRTAAARFGNIGFEFRYYDAFTYHQRDLVVGYQKMVNTIQKAGVSLLVETPVKEISTASDGFLLRTARSDAYSEILARRVVLAVGRYGIELMKSIDSTFDLQVEPNHMDFGVRLEFPTILWPEIDSCHNDLKLHFGSARTFCVCKDGMIAPYRVDDTFFVEGTSDPDSLTGLTNIGITVRYEPRDLSEQHALLSELRANHLQISTGIPIRQCLTDFLCGRAPTDVGVDETASIRYWRWGDANHCLPQKIAPSVNDAVRYFASRFFPEEVRRNVYVFAPLVDYYWPRFPGRTDFSSRTEGLYLVGDCLGRFRGILQGFCSGLICAERMSRSSR